MDILSALFVMPAAQQPPEPTVVVRNVTDWPVNQQRTIEVVGRGFPVSAATTATGAAEVQGVTVSFGPRPEPAPAQDNVSAAAVSAQTAAKRVTVRPASTGKFVATMKVSGMYVDATGAAWDGKQQQLGIHISAPGVVVEFLPVSFAAPAKYDSTTRAVLSRPMAMRSRGVTLRIRVDSDFPATGTATVFTGKRAGKKVRELRIVDGKAQMRLPAKLRGRDKFRVRYSGDDEVAPSWSNPVWFWDR